METDTKKGLYLRFVLVYVFVIINLFSVKIEEVSNFVGIRDNQLIGYGVVVGLDDTGDSGSIVTKKSLSNILAVSNIKVEAKQLSSGNIASVIITAILPSFARQGDKLDITISSIGDAKSLKGGTLLLTPLKGVDKHIYALAQGAISIPAGKIGSKNHLTSGSILGGAIVEKEIKNRLFYKKNISISLKKGSFQNAINIQKAINKKFSKSIAIAKDAKTIFVNKDKDYGMIEFLSILEKIDVVYVKKEKIIIDEKTGTIIAGISVKVDPVMITHGDLIVKISPRIIPVPVKDDIGGGMSVDIDNGTIFTEKRRPSIANIARALQKMGARPKDIVSIIVAMKKAGAISVDIEIL
jgi:flagellar P-ring protein precursor FlgI